VYFGFTDSLVGIWQRPLGLYIYCTVNIDAVSNICHYGHIYCAANNKMSLINKQNTSEKRLIGQFIEALQGLPNVHATLDQLEPATPTGNRGPDARIHLQAAGKSFILLIEAKKTVYPRDVQQQIWKLRELIRGEIPSVGEGESKLLLVAESISPGAKELLRSEGIGYYDGGGSLFLPAKGAYLYIDKPPPKSMSKSIGSLFSGRRGQVLHALLMHHQIWYGGKELAEQAMVSPATASQVLSELERFDWVESRGQGPSKERRLKEPATLLDAWAKHMEAMPPQGFRRYYVPAIKPEALLDHIGTVFAVHGIEYAISYEAAAQSYAPFLTGISQVRCRLLEDPAADAALMALNARVVSQGANLAIIEAKSSGELLFRERIHEIWLASPIQVYLDLMRSEGRAKEMADHLRKERIGF